MRRAAAEETESDQAAQKAARERLRDGLRAFDQPDFFCRGVGDGERARRERSAGRCECERNRNRANVDAAGGLHRVEIDDGDVRAVRIDEVRVLRIDFEVGRERRHAHAAADRERRYRHFLHQSLGARIDVQPAVRFAKKGRIGAGADGRSRAVRADPFESPRIALEEVKRWSDEDARDRRLARAHRSSASRFERDDARLVRERVENRDSFIGRRDGLRRW